METRFFTTEDKELQEAAGLLKAGGLVAFPTETVYGLGVDAFDPGAANKAYAAKGRPADNPLIVHIAKFDDLYRLVPKDAVNERVRLLAEVFWPGPLTMVLPKLGELPKETTGGLDTVAVRMPASEPALKFIEMSGCCVAGPSANLSGKPSSTTWQHVAADFFENIDGIICGEPCEGGIESTVLDIASLTIYRPGFVSPEMISAVLGEEVSYDDALYGLPGEDEDSKPKAPGTKYKHYAPKAEMHILWGSEKSVTRVIKTARFTAGLRRRKIYVIDKIEPGTFFAKLREADEQGADLILARALDTDDSVSFAVMNRALKASGYSLIKV